MSFDFEEFANSYISDLRETLSKLPMGPIRDFWRMVEEIRSSDGSVHFIGNGGSAATPSHSAGDWSKELSLRTISHSDNTSSLTAWSNDTEYSNVFVGQLSTFIRKGDMVVAYSGSGNSENVLNGISFAREMGCSTVAVTGNYGENSGGQLAQMVDIAIVVPTTSMERIEDVQLVINHIIKEAVKSNNGL